MGMRRKEEHEIDYSIHTNVEAKQGAKKELIILPDEPRYTFDDLVLPQRTKAELMNLANYEFNSKLVFEIWGLGKTHKYSKRMGVNFYGPPGTGKTMAAHALSNYLRRKILTVNYAEIESKYVGETPKNINKVFEIAEKTHSILFFDEADAILSRRVTDMSSAADVSVNQTRSVLLERLNRYQDFVIFATNFIENFDPAFMRRISHHIHFELPDEECRYRLWRQYIPTTMPNDIDIAMIAKEYKNLSGSDISNAVLMAAFSAAGNHENVVHQKYLINAIENIIESKKANERRQAITTKRVVSEKYVKKQLEEK